MQSKITRHIAKKKNMTYNKGFYQLIETEPEMTEIMKFLEKNTKSSCYKS